MNYLETPEEAARRWRRENTEAGRVDQRGATLLSPEEMDQRTTASIRAQRDFAARIGGRSIEGWEEAYLGDVVAFIRGVPVPFEIVSSSWGVWWANKWEEAPDDRVVVCYDRDGSARSAFCAIADVRAAPVESSGGFPNRLVPIAELRRGLYAGWGT